MTPAGGDRGGAAPISGHSPQITKSRHHQITK
jgi:hypothetical protein